MSAIAWELPEEIRAVREGLLEFARQEVLTRHEKHHDLFENPRRLYREDGRFSDELKGLIGEVTPRLPPVADCALGCRHALDTAIITAPEARDPELIAKLDTVAGRVLRKN